METLHKEFQKARQTNISFDEFQILVLSYPIFKVANADGNFDNEESQLLTEILTNFLSEIYENNLNEEEIKKLALLFIEDLLFIDSNSQKFDLALLDSLSSFSMEIKRSIVDLLIEIAEVSGGLDKQENEMIENLTKNYLS